MHKDYRPYSIHKDADFVFDRIAKIMNLWFKGHKHSVVMFLAKLTEESCPSIADKNVTVEELKQSGLIGFEFSVRPIWRERE